MTAQEMDHGESEAWANFLAATDPSKGVRAIRIPRGWLGEEPVVNAGIEPQIELVRPQLTGIVYINNLSEEPLRKPQLVEPNK